MPSEESEFVSLLRQLADGEKWKVVRGEGWDAFAQTLGTAIGSLDVRRRQAILMALVAVSTGSVQPEEVNNFLEGRDLDDDNQVTAFIDWLRAHRPKFFEL
jgi:hypothetical protein